MMGAVPFNFAQLHVKPVCYLDWMHSFGAALFAFVVKNQLFPYRNGFVLCFLRLDFRPNSYRIGRKCGCFTFT